MKVTPTIQKIILSAVILCLILFVVYTTLFSDEELPLADGVLLIDGVPLVNVPGQEILLLAESLEKVNIDKSIFSAALFTNLVDISVEVVPEPQGRTNPFLPIEVYTSSISGSKSVKLP